jgi:hypothetical protein
MKWAEDVACRGNLRNAHEILVRKPEWNRQLEDMGTDGDNIKMDLKEIILR